MAFLRIRDIELCYQVEGSGPPLLKIWGTGGDLRRPATDFDRRLAEHFTVLAFDQRGMGRSGKPARDYSMADYADDAGALMEAVGIVDTHLLGSHRRGSSGVWETSTQTKNDRRSRSLSGGWS